jgi:hypothetical protein
VVLIKKGVKVINENKYERPILCKSLFGYVGKFKTNLIPILIENGAYLRVKFREKMNQQHIEEYDNLMAQNEIQKRARLRLWVVFMRQTDIKAKVTVGVQQASRDKEQPQPKRAKV